MKYKLLKYSLVSLFVMLFGNVYGTTNATNALTSNKQYTTIADMLKDVTATKADIEFTFTSLIVTYVNGKYTYVNDGTGNMLLYGVNTGWEYGKVFNGTLVGKLYTYNDLPEIQISATSDINATAAPGMIAMPYAVITVDQLPDYVNALCGIMNAQYVSTDASNDKKMYFKVGGKDLVVFNQFGINMGTLVAGKKYTLSGVGGVNKGTYQLYPTEINQVAIYNITFAAGEGAGVAPAKLEINPGDKISAPKNYTLYAEGKTLTGWSDGTKTYAIDEEITPTSDMTLTAVYTENRVSLDDRSEPISLEFVLNGYNDAPKYHFEGVNGIIVTQATIGKNIIDVKADVNATNGKFAHNGSGWHQVNTGTVVTVPSCKDAIIAVTTYNDATSITFNGGKDNAEINESTVNYYCPSSNATATIEQVSNNYWNRLMVTLPVVGDDPQPITENIFAKWDFVNNCAKLASKSEGGSYTAETMASDQEGVVMNIIYNGGQIKNNDNSYLVTQGVEMQIPVKNAGDVVTVVGYPGYYSYSVGGKNATDNTTIHEATSAEATKGYVSVVSTGNSNYINSINVMMYAPKGKITLDNEPATATFGFHLGTEAQKAIFSEADYFLSSKFTYGSGLILDGKDNKSLDQTWFNVAAKDSKANEGNAISFIITPKPGLTFTPTKASFKTTRYGTNGGKLDIAWKNPDGTTVALASDVQPNRDNATPNISELSYDIKGANAAEGACGLVVNLYSLDPGKHVGFSDIVLEGTLSGTEKDVPVLESFKINNEDYAVEDVFGEQYEATLKLSKKEAMVSAQNPLTDVTATIGEIGTITYEATETTCKVTIPMTAGETQMNYVLNIIQKPDYKLSYIAVDGKTVLKEQKVEEDAVIGEFACNIADVASSKEGYKARGWFKQDYVGPKYTTEDFVTGNINLYAVETEIEVPSNSRKYVYDLTGDFFDEDHEGFNSIGSGYWHDGTHGWAFNNGDKIELLVGPKATINFTLCQYSAAGATIVASNGASINAKVDNDGGAASIDYEGEAGTLTLTINSTGAVYIHAITVFNTSETNYTKQGDWIIVKKGDASSLLDAIEVAKGIEGAKIFLPNGTYDLGTTVKTIISGKNVSLIGQSAEKTIIVNRPPLAIEGLDKADLLKNTGEGLYMQDLTLKNDMAYGTTEAGRAAALHDTGTKTICKNVNLLSHQDTYYSHKVGGLYYFEGGELHGTVDYLCGNGKVYYNEVKLVNEKRSSATITANSELYVFNNCTVENNADSYNLGRAWSDNPTCVYLNTTLLAPSKLVSTRWNLNGLNCDYAVAGEYGTKDANGNNITPESNIVTFTKQNTKMNTILDATALETYSIKNVLGTWAETALIETRQLDASVQGAEYKDGAVTFWLTDNMMTGCALFKNGEFVAISTDGVFSNVDIDPTKDVLTIRTANARGGFGPEAVVEGTATSIDKVNKDILINNIIYNLNGQRVEKPAKGLYIINGRKVVVK